MMLGVSFNDGLDCRTHSASTRNPFSRGKAVVVPESRPKGGFRASGRARDKNDRKDIP
jgi:hypothetical protein